VGHENLRDWIVGSGYFHLHLVPSAPATKNTDSHVKESRRILHRLAIPSRQSLKRLLAISLCKSPLYVHSLHFGRSHDISPAPALGPIQQSQHFPTESLPSSCNPAAALDLRKSGEPEIYFFSQTFAASLTFHVSHPTRLRFIALSEPISFESMPVAPSALR
jgi:hypothetical protein